MVVVVVVVCVWGGAGENGNGLTDPAAWHVMAPHLSRLPDFWLLLALALA